MIKLSNLIEEKKKTFANHKFFSYICDTSRSLEERLSFLPNMSHFIMSFGDINKYILPFPLPQNDLEKAINTHAEEDSNHWPWFISDLQQLNMNNSQPLTDTLRYLWSDELSASRRLTYDLIELITGKHAKFRLVIIEIMEATGNVMFTALSEITAKSNFMLKFCGSLHANHESGHTMGSDVGLINTLVFSEDEQKLAAFYIDKGFMAFHHFIDQLLLEAEKSTTISPRPQQ
ncbi:hypothetical protein ACUTQ5_08435 [Serratia sp. NA_112.1]|uniref:hypothetical protein n=1 Tax=Serratia sp. NA_112.1 TaxID=3415665 RepID=UPI0040469BC1